MPTAHWRLPCCWRWWLRSHLPVVASPGLRGVREAHREDEIGGRRHVAHSGPVELELRRIEDHFKTLITAVTLKYGVSSALSLTSSPNEPPTLSTWSLSSAMCDLGAWESGHPATGQTIPLFTPMSRWLVWTWPSWSLAASLNFPFSCTPHSRH